MQTAPLAQDAAQNAAAARPTDADAARDYLRVKAAIEWIDAHAVDQPSLEQAATASGLSPHHFQRMFTRWAGVSPKRYLACLTRAHARRLLAEDRPLLDVALEVGLSGPSRLHDLFVTQQAMTPAEAKRGGAGLRLRWTVADSPFGAAVLMASPRGVCAIGFADPGAEDATFADLAGRWPSAAYTRDDAGLSDLAARVFAGRGADDGPIPVHLMGSPFQLQVWEGLLRIPPAQAWSYDRLAAAIGRPGASRAVGTANARNPVSFVVPCHRVLRKTGDFGGYHWGGEARKRAMLAWETLRAEAAAH